MEMDLALVGRIFGEKAPCSHGSPSGAEQFFANAEVEGVMYLERVSQGYLLAHWCVDPKWEGKKVAGVDWQGFGKWESQGHLAKKIPERVNVSGAKEWKGDAVNMNGSGTESQVEMGKATWFSERAAESM
ncbi:MAG: hypothetical protein Q9166_005177 [cf. Caloplaca sp. 2 TL-2023]